MEPPDETERHRREEWFNQYVNRESVHRPRERGPYCCPCCGNLTLDERGGSDICQVCFWEDDGQDDHDASVVRGGPNGSLSLTQARENYREFGACERAMIEYVRPPHPHEMPV
jgi:hypothetical protein